MSHFWWLLFIQVLSLLSIFCLVLSWFSSSAHHCYWVQVHPVKLLNINSSGVSRVAFSHFVLCCCVLSHYFFSNYWKPALILTHNLLPEVCRETRWARARWGRAVLWQRATTGSASGGFWSVSGRAALLLQLQACWLFELKLWFKPERGKFCIFTESVWSQVCGLPWRVAKAVAPATESSEATKAICISVWHESGQQRDRSRRHDRKRGSLCLVNIKYSFPDLWTSCLFNCYVSRIYLCMQHTCFIMGLCGSNENYFCLWL